MPDMGLALGGEAGGAALGLKDVLQQKFLQQQEANRQAQLQVENQQHAQQLQQQQQFQQAQIEKMQAEAKTQADERAAMVGVRNVQAATELAPKLPMDQNVSPEAAGVLKTGGMGGNLFTPPTMAEGENGQTIQNGNPSVNLGTPEQQQDAQKRVDVGKLITQLGANDPRRLAAQTYLASHGDDKLAALMDPKATQEPLEQVQTPKGPVFLPRSQAVGKTPYHVPPTNDSDEVVMQGATGPVIVNKRTGASRPVTDGSGAAMGLKPSAQMQTHEMAKGEAQDTLNQLDQALEQAKDLVGPGEGRVSNVEQLIGNQDPRLNTLGAKMLAAKVKVNAALTPSVRSGMNPSALSAWDNLLANKITPEGMKATIQAMRDVVGKPSTGAAPSTGVVRKYNPATGKLE